MAQVLAPIVQTTGPITMLHSSSDAFQNPPQQQPHHQQSRPAQMPRGQMYNAQNGNVGYRGTAAAPIAPYAFSSTPQLRQENRSSSAPGNPYAQQQPMLQTNQTRLGHPSHPSSSSDSTVSTSGSSSRSSAGPPYAVKDDNALSSENRKSMVEGPPSLAIPSFTSVPDLSFSPTVDVQAKPSPDRYRRAGARRTDSSNTVTSASASTPTQQSPSINVSSFSASQKLASVPSLATTEAELPFRPGHSRANSADDMQLPRQGGMDAAKRYRRRSLGGFEGIGSSTPAPKSLTMAPVSSASVSPPARNTSQEIRPTSSAGRPSSSHERQGSAGSSASNVSARPSSSRQDSGSARSPVLGANRPPSRNAEPPRRVNAPSPLSKPMSPSEPPSPAKKVAEQAAAAPAAPSPAMQQLSALNDKESSKGMKSRLRRAFSFGSAAELRRASAENNLSAERAKLRKEKYQNEQDAENDAIIAKQEAAGIGAGIYSGQGGFSGSTDNLSISSTASSASIMLRKMGSGMKKGGRSIKGLFRPKSVIGVPAADTAVTQPSVGQVSMVTVEAERQKVNVNADPHEQVGGGTGYPRLERNSMDASRPIIEADASPSQSAESWSRKSIVGGERERAEVLSSIKKGILKRHGAGSDAPSPIAKPADIPHPTDTPKSSAPSTPNDDHRGVQVQIHPQDYFGGPPRLGNSSTRSLPTTPNGTLRNISFSPRIQFYDAWSATDYDRRGDIATCNRLTPMLAQQIKEELNSFKMEMEVHEMSKPHTHFF